VRRKEKTDKLTAEDAEDAEKTSFMTSFVNFVSFVDHFLLSLLSASPASSAVSFLFCFFERLLLGGQFHGFAILRNADVPAHLLANLFGKGQRRLLLAVGDEELTRRLLEMT